MALLKTVALRALQTSEAAGSSKLLYNAALFSSRAGAAAADEAVTASSAFQVLAQQQVSPAAAAAMAAKKAYIGGAANGLALKPSTRAFGTFASKAAAPAAVATEAAAQQAESKPSMLKRLAKGAAAVFGALALATGVASADSPEEWQWGFQDTASSTAQAMVDLHHDIMFFLITILTVVLYMLFQIVTKFHYTRVVKPEKLTHHTTLEVIWTVIPTIIVLSIAVPSLSLVYSLDQHVDRPGLTVKVIGRQWYWSYEMHDHLQQKLLDPERLVSIAEKSVVKA